ncbi:TonB-dependent receptor [Prevotella sp. E13-17]|uniref:SusC/RagA family TonB-linked outer membrane protein n=1 Tax=Prevotella sp. E13-17 TaxID=2913616 RepID=UPI001EDA8F92|nr:TonB-dependent receptor [Prevotella sp. E13-17]UKK51403.1 TonB-dependent receptor [Prevotella sp. E13-17]
MKEKRFLWLLLALVVSMATQAQNILGTVTDEHGEPLIGVSVVEKSNPQNGTVTNLDGQFSIRVNEGAVVVCSYIGYVTQEMKATRGMKVMLKEDSQVLQDVVVIGYGVQKKSVVTAAIAKVSADDLDGKTRLRAEDALKGLAAGVNVTSSSGQPGSKSMVRIRGIGTINDSNPLYIIDGMPTDQNGMESVNPYDIESIEVLKDAASGAIYGARAANGVILVTTKKGKMGKASINYNFGYGWQSAWKKRDVTGATDYAILQNEAAVQNGMAPIYQDPYNLVDANGRAIKGFGTDWQDLVFNDNAPIAQHDVSISGATEKANYYLSLGYLTQEGIVGGNYGHSNYDRLTIRSNNQYNLFDDSKERSFLNKLDLSANISYMRVHNTGVETNSTWGSPLGSALYLAPVLPVTLDAGYDRDGNALAGEKMMDQYAKYELYRNDQGNPYTIPNYVGSYNEQVNPIALMQGTPTRNWSHKFMPKFSLDLQLWDELKYHFTYSAELSFWGYDAATKQKFYLSGNNNADHTSATSYKGNNSTWQVENTLTYDKIFGKHTIGVVLGQSAMKFKGDELGGSHWNLVNINKPSLNYTTGGDLELSTDANGKITGAKSLVGAWGGPYTEHHLSSLFARVSYNYDEKYMLQGTIRRDGSSRFGSNNKYGVFPSFSFGWNIMNEDFMKDTRDWLSNLKLRASWGKNGNDNIGDFAYTTLTTIGASSNYYFGQTASMVYGSKANRLANEDLKWEESEQTDLGLDVGFWNNQLTFSVDYFVKKTNGMIIEMPIPSYVGEARPLANVGDMENSGVEFELGYKWHISDAHFAVKGNASYLKNKLKNLGNDNGFLDFGINQFSDGGTRAENGQPFPFFYGYKTNGILQNQAEADAYNAKYGTSSNPGDFRFVDTNRDNAITSDDRTNIGNGVPDWTFGLNFDAEWKGFDLSVFFQGVSGADVFDATYRQDIPSGNYPTWILQRWTGEGTSNTVPTIGNSKNWVCSDMYIQDGSYLRLKNITLGYTLPRHLTRKVGVSRLRLYARAENLFTWTKYWGFDPEIGSGSTSLGVDYGVYPQARTYTLGFNISL